MMITKDKKEHFVAGLLIASYVVILLNLFGLDNTEFVGFAVALFIGAIKETVYDKCMKKGTPETLDFLWTGLGGLIADTLFNLIL